MFNLLKIYSLVLLGLLFNYNVFAQTVPNPSFNTFEPIQVGKSHNQNSDNTNKANHPSPKPSSNSNNNSIHTSQPLSPSEVKQIVLSSINYEEKNNKEISYKMPPCNNLEGKNHYDQAYISYLDMLEGREKLDIGKAIFLTENAYLGNKLKYEDFDRQLNEIISFCKRKLKENKTENDPLAKIMILHRYFSDTLKVWNPQKGKMDIHYPFKYDFNDYWGHEDWTKLFVTKLLATNSGQCHSLPLLFIALAQRMGVKANLSYSPEHSYIRFHDNKGRWYNLELTNGMLTSDSWISGSGFVKSEAIKSGIYMDTLSQKQTVAYCLMDLAKGYGLKYCYDEFVLQALNTGLKHHSNNIYGLQIKSDYYTLWFHHALQQAGKPSPNEIHRYPDAEAILKQRNQIYALIDNLGYEQMPKEAYEQWLKSLEQEKEKQEHHNKLINLENSINR